MSVTELRAKDPAGGLKFCITITTIHVTKLILFYDYDDNKYFSCLEEISPYLRKPFPRKIIYLNPLTHI